MTEIAEDVVLGESQGSAPTAAPAVPSPVATALTVLFALSASHMLNDIIQSLLPAMYPILKTSYGLTFTQIGLITFTFQVTASLLQPLVGSYTDKRPKPYSLAIGMSVTLIGLLLLSRATTMPSIHLAAGMVGIGSSVFHPEASRMAHAAAGRRHGLAQSLFQVGGNFGTSLGPLLAAWIIVPRGQHAAAWFSLVAVAAIMILSRVGAWYSARLRSGLGVKSKASGTARPAPLSPNRTVFAIAMLVVLVVSKYFYLISLTNYYTFYMMHKFGASVRTSQVYLFLFLFSVAAGTILGGPIGDRYGRKAVIWASILGVAPFTLLLPHLNLLGTVLTSLAIGLILASAFSAILVFAQELLPGRVGLVAGLFFGFAFGVSGIASALLGRMADHSGIEYVFQFCAYLPLFGLFAAFLPNVETSHQKTAKKI